ncbi:MAG: MaoC family dehydratase N-terminal domain-containing protein, partial [Anaerolineae bacterium]|nr:MaoC family dehydratase N-terminal domain-containing protein [Anaerolineae bacterium]
MTRSRLDVRVRHLSQPEVKVALDKRFIGRKFDPFSFEVDRSKIRELAQALGDDNPVFIDDDEARASGLPGIVAPPTFPT